MSESRKRIKEIHNFTPEEFYSYIKQMIQKYPTEDDTGLLQDKIQKNDKLIEDKRWNYDNDFIKKMFKANFQRTIDDVLDNIEKTIDGQPIYRAITICQEKNEINLDDIKIREPIGKSWSYIPATESYYAKYCPPPNSEIPLLIKAKLIDPEGIDIDKSFILNLNWSRRNLEHEINLKENAKVHVDEICEKNYLGRKHTSNLPIPMIKQCKKINQDFTN